MYGLLLFGSIVTMFLYTMRLHLNGILQDAFWRIMVVNEATCFLPDDLEISVSELQHILTHAERWRGKNGERRKIVVERLTTTDAQDEEYKREDMHVRIVQLDCGNARRWFGNKAQSTHREFFITKDGTVLELMDGEGGGTQGMMGAAVGIGFLLNNLANTMRSKTMDAWKGIFKGIGGGHRGSVAGAGESDFFLRAARAGGNGVGGGFDQRRASIISGDGENHHMMRSTNVEGEDVESPYFGRGGRHEATNNQGNRRSSFLGGGPGAGASGAGDFAQEESFTRFGADFGEFGSNSFSGSFY